MSGIYHILYLLIINTFCQRSWWSSLLKMGHLHLVIVIGPILPISGYFNRRVLYCNITYTILYLTILITFIIQYYKMYYMNIQYTLYLRLLPDCSSCVPVPWTHLNSLISRFWVVFLGTKSASLVRKNLRTAING